MQDVGQAVMISANVTYRGVGFVINSIYGILFYYLHDNPK